MSAPHAFDNSVDAQARRFVQAYPTFTARDAQGVIGDHRELHRQAMERVGATDNVNAYGAAIDDLQSSLDHAVHETQSQPAGFLSYDERVDLAREGIEANNAKTMAVYDVLMAGQ